VSSWIGGFADAADDAVGGTADVIGDAGAWVGGGIADTVTGTADVIGDTAGELGEGVGDAAGGVAGGVFGGLGRWMLMAAGLILAAVVLIKVM
jgi:hypothetical protein